jgi:hypothetical protein
MVTKAEVTDMKIKIKLFEEFNYKMLNPLTWEEYLEYIDIVDEYESKYGYIRLNENIRKFPSQERVFARAERIYR